MEEEWVKTKCLACEDIIYAKLEKNSWKFKLFNIFTLGLAEEDRDYKRVCCYCPKCKQFIKKKAEIKRKEFILNRDKLLEIK